MKWVRAIGGIAVAIGLVVGWKFYNKFSTAGTVRDTLLSICAEERQCVSAVEKHFQPCFDAHYSFGGRRQAGYLKGDQFMDCLLEQSGAPYFKDPSK